MDSVLCQDDDGSEATSTGYDMGSILDDCKSSEDGSFASFFGEATSLRERIFVEDEHSVLHNSRCNSSCSNSDKSFGAKYSRGSAEMPDYLKEESLEAGPRQKEKFRRIFRNDSQMSDSSQASGIARASQKALSTFRYVTRQSSRMSNSLDRNETVGLTERKSTPDRRPSLTNVASQRFNTAFFRAKNKEIPHEEVSDGSADDEFFMIQKAESFRAESSESMCSSNDNTLSGAHNGVGLAVDRTENTSVPTCVANGFLDVSDSEDVQLAEQAVGMVNNEPSRNRCLAKSIGQNQRHGKTQLIQKTPSRPDSEKQTISRKSRVKRVPRDKQPRRSLSADDALHEANRPVQSINNRTRSVKAPSRNFRFSSIPVQNSSNGSREEDSPGQEPITEEQQHSSRGKNIPRRPSQRSARSSEGPCHSVHNHGCLSRQSSRRSDSSCLSSSSSDGTDGLRECSDVPEDCQRKSVPRDKTRSPILRRSKSQLSDCTRALRCNSAESQKPVPNLTRKASRHGPETFKGVSSNTARDLGVCDRSEKVASTEPVCMPYRRPSLPKITQFMVEAGRDQPGITLVPTSIVNDRMHKAEQAIDPDKIPMGMERSVKTDERIVHTQECQQKPLRPDSTKKNTSSGSRVRPDRRMQGVQDDEDESKRNSENPRVKIERSASLSLLQQKEQSSDPLQPTKNHHRSSSRSDESSRNSSRSGHSSRSTKGHNRDHSPRHSSHSLSSTDHSPRKPSRRHSSRSTDVPRSRPIDGPRRYSSRSSGHRHDRPSDNLQHNKSSRRSERSHTNAKPLENGQNEKSLSVSDGSISRRVLTALPA